MQLRLLEQQFQAYKNFLRGPDAMERRFVWESQRIFQENWDLEAVDLSAMYDRSLENSSTRRLWRRENYEPKAMMLKFLHMAPEFVRTMFRDLFQEEKAVDGRAQRFVFYCDELLQAYKKQHPHSIENSHFHDDDYHMVFLYLAFRFPDRYSLYDSDAFTGTLKKIGAVDLPKANDLERFVKVTNTLFKLMSRDDDLIAAHRERIREDLYYKGDSKLLVFDFYYFCGRET